MPCPSGMTGVGDPGKNRDGPKFWRGGPPESATAETSASRVYGKHGRLEAAARGIVNLVGLIVAIPIAAVGEYLVSMCSRVVYEASHAGPVCSVGRVASPFILGDVWEHTERARKSDAHGRIVVYVFRCDHQIPPS